MKLPTKKIELMVANGRFGIDPAELKDKGLVGRIMWDIAFCAPDCCRDKNSYLKLLELTAKEIITRVQERPDGKE